MRAWPGTLIRQTPQALALLGLLLVLAGCLPTVAPRGEAAQQARLTANSFLADDGAVLSYQSWLPSEEPKAVIVAVHGMNEYSGAFTLPAPALCAQGLAVYALDQRGFGASPHRGLWPGEENLADDLATFARLLKARHPDKPLYLLGESMGGGVALLAAGRDAALPVAGLILVAPAVSPWEELPPLWRVPLWISAYTFPSASLTGRGLDLRPTDNIEAWREMSRDPLVIKGTRVDAIYGLTQLMDQAAAAVSQISTPTLLLYGAQDDFVRSWMVTWVLDNAKADQVEVRNYETGYHWLLRDLNAKIVLDDIVAWIEQRDAEIAQGGS